MSAVMTLCCSQSTRPSPSSWMGID
jgi:hypothetical protein